MEERMCNLQLLYIPDMNNNRCVYLFVKSQIIIHCCIHTYTYRTFSLVCNSLNTLIEKYTQYKILLDIIRSITHLLILDDNVTIKYLQVDKRLLILKKMKKLNEKVQKRNNEKSKSRKKVLLLWRNKCAVFSCYTFQI